MQDGGADGAGEALPGVVRDAGRRTGRRAAAAIALLAGALLAGAAAAERLPLRRITSADGLPHDQVRCILRDTRGFLWFGTQDGLARYDGASFRTYDTRHGLLSAAILSLLETRDGSLWAGTQDGLCRFAPAGPAARLFECFRLGRTLLSRSVLALLEDRSGTIWAGTADGLFQVERGGNGIRVRAAALGLPDPDRSLEVGALAVDHDGCLWAGTFAGLARRCGERPFRDFRLQPGKRDNNRVFGLLVDRAGRVWAGLAYDGVLVFMPGGPDWTMGEDLLAAARRPAADTAGVAAAADASPRRPRLPRQPGEAVNLAVAAGLAHPMARGGLWASADGTIWIGTVGGLSRFDGERVDRFGDITDSIRFVGAEDRAGNLWFGTEYSGAVRVNARGFVTYDQEDGLTQRRVRSVFLGRDGVVHALTATNVVCRFDGHRFVTVTAAVPPGTDLGWSYHQSSFQDSRAEWWIATAEGLLHFPATARTADLGRERPLATYTTADGLPGNGIFRLFEDSRHDLWVATLDGLGLALWERSSGTFRRFPAASGLPDDAPTAFAEDRAGQVWIGFYHGGLARYAAGRFTWYPPGRDGAPAGWVGDLFVDSGGRLWIACAVSGLSRIDDPAAPEPHLSQVSTAAAGLASNLVHGVVEDVYHRLYVCTGRGVDRFDLASGGVAHFTVADGLPSSEVLTALRDRAGDLWFATPTGLARLSPRPTRAATPPAALLMAVRVDGRAQPLSQLGTAEMAGLELRPGGHQIEIDSVAIGSEPGEATRYQHRLAGRGGDAGGWGTPSSEPRVVYDALAPGTYDFFVRALASDGRPGPAARLAFSVLAPWWRRPWALAAGAAALCGLAYTGYRFRLAHLLSLERVRMRLATDLHDDLGASLSRISLLSEVAAREIPAEAARSRTIVREIGGLARELFDATADIVWAIDPRRDNLGSLVARLSEYARDVLSAQDASWSLRAPHGLDLVMVAADCRRELYLLLKEAIHNAARHSGASAVSLTLTLDGSRLRAEVADNGRGYAAGDAGGARAAGDGLRNMRTRAAALGGSCAVDSAPGRGSRVHVELVLVH